MKRFEFRLETLLELRGRKEDALKLELGKKIQGIMIAQRELAAIVEELKALQGEEKRIRPRTTSAVELRYGIAYRFKLKKDILLKGRLIDDLQAQTHAVRAKLVKARQERRAIEIIRERQYAAWKKAYRIQEQGLIDDVSQQAYIRRAREAAAAAP